MKRLPLYAALLLLTQCSKCKDDPEPLNELPPATQEGKQTFGCLVNGQAWTPKGHAGTIPNFYVSYDPTYAGGALNVTAYRYPNANDKNRQSIGVFCDSAANTGLYALDQIGHRGAYFEDRRTNCIYDSSRPDVYCRGKLTLTRLDVRAGIVAGTFDFVLAKPGCDTVRVTNGRFDYRLF